MNFLSYQKAGLSYSSNSSLVSSVSSSVSSSASSLLIVIVQMYWGISLVNNPIEIITGISWENIVLFSLHIFTLIISEIFFLGKFKIELS